MLTCSFWFLCDETGCCWILRIRCSAHQGRAPGRRCLRFAEPVASAVHGLDGQMDFRLGQQKFLSQRQGRSAGFLSKGMTQLFFFLKKFFFHFLLSAFKLRDSHVLYILNQYNASNVILSSERNRSPQSTPPPRPSAAIVNCSWL